MIYLILTILGVALGSFVNALVWRTYVSKNKNQDISVWRGRSMCTHCRHVLGPLDLVPIFSWLVLRGKCRYCHKTIEDTPFSELLLPSLFVISYIMWPFGFELIGIALFMLWIAVLTVFVAMTIYDIRWTILPDTYTLVFTVLAVVIVFLQFLQASSYEVIWLSVLGGLLVGGVFYTLHAVSRGAWIGGGDVKLGFGLGIIVGSPLAGLLVVFIASVMGTLIALPGLVFKRLTYQDKLPFGPFLIMAAIIVFLLGERLQTWYMSTLIGI